MERHLESAAAQDLINNANDERSRSPAEQSQGRLRKDDDIEIVERQENHRLRMESELLTIESQFLRSTRHEADRLHQEIADLHQRLSAAHEEIHRLTEAEHQLRRLLTMVNNSPFGFVARRKWGFRKMVEQWL